MPIGLPVALRGIRGMLRRRGLIAGLWWGLGWWRRGHWCRDWCGLRRGGILTAGGGQKIVPVIGDHAATLHALSLIGVKGRGCVHLL